MATGLSSINFFRLFFRIRIDDNESFFREESPADFHDLSASIVFVDYYRIIDGQPSLLPLRSCAFIDTIGF